VHRSIPANPWLFILLLAALVGVSGVQARPHAYDDALFQAGNLQDAGQLARAAEQIARAAALFPLRIDLWEMAGDYALQADDAAAAIRYLERGASAAGQGGPFPGGLSHQGWLALGDAYRQAEDRPAALRAWQVGNAVYGPDGDYLERLVQVRLDLGDFSGAVTDLQNLAALQPQNSRLRYQQGLILATYEPAQALGPLDQAAALDPAYAVAAAGLRRALISARDADAPAYTLLLVGRALADLGEWGMAFQAFDRAARLRADYAETWAYLGEARQHPGEGSLLPLPAPANPELARQNLETALALDSHSLSGLAFLSLYWSRQTRHDLALQIIDQALALDPQNPALLVQKANTQAAAGQFADADATFRQAIDLSPHAPTYSQYRIEFMLHYNYQIEQQALPVARRLVVDFPQDPAVLDLMAQVFIQLNDLLSARRFLEQALQINPDFAAAHLHLGQVALLQGDRRAARQSLEHAQALAPFGPVNALAQRLLDHYVR